MVIGTVKGDIHDIGKNLVGMMLEGAGFEVIDLGINCDVDKYLKALEEHKPDILGMSALLTTTMPYMKVVIDTMKEKGIRDDYVVLVGGAPLNEAFAEAVGRRRLLPRRRGRGRDRQGLCRAAATTCAAACRREPMAPARTLLIACGALARETLAAIEANGLAPCRGDLHLGAAAQPAGANPGRRAREDPRASRRVRAHPRALRRLRHRRRARPRAGRGGRGADRRPALLRLLCRARRCSTRWPRPSPAPST